jgi:hypothetical protein
LSSHLSLAPQSFFSHQYLSISTLDIPGCQPL